MISVCDLTAAVSVIFISSKICLVNNESITSTRIPENITRNIGTSSTRKNSGSTENSMLVSSTASSFSSSSTAPPQKDFSSIKNVDEYIKSDPSAQNFLLSIKNDNERLVVQRQLTFCPFVPLCNFSFEVYSSESCCERCSCDISRCLQSANCCPDLMTKERTDIVLREQLEKEKSCIPLSFWNYTTGVMAFTNCSSFDNASLVTNCSRLYTRRAVSSIYDTLPCRSNLTFEVYRNKYCALCNGESEVNLQYFEAMFTDKTGKSNTIYSPYIVLSLALTSESFETTFSPPDTTVAVLACKPIVERCNIREKIITYDPLIEEACKTYESRIQQRNMVYKNIFCASCNDENITETTCSKQEEQIGSAFTGHLNLNQYDVQTVNETIETPCPPGQYYDPINVSFLLLKFNVPFDL